MSSSWSMPTNAEQPPNLSSHVMQYSPYISPSDIENHSYVPYRSSAAQEDKQRQQACGFIEAVGAKLGLYVARNPLRLWAKTLHYPAYISPRKTIATAQNLYHRFNLFLHRTDNKYYVGAFPMVASPSDTSLIMWVGRYAGRTLCLDQDA